jgi:hypothetical protein
MSVLLRRVARYVVQRAASDPEIRKKAGRIARRVLQEAEHVAKDDDRALAAGRAFRRAVNNLRRKQ